MRFKVVLREDYLSNKNKYLNDISILYLNDSSKLANIEDIIRHLDFIFNVPNSLLVLLYDRDKLVSMVNGYEYNNINHDWCICSLFTNKEYRGNGLGYQVLKYIIEEIKKYNPNKIVSGIEEDNISSIKIHEKIGFINSGLKWNEIEEGFPEDHLGFIYKLDKRK